MQATIESNTEVRNILEARETRIADYLRAKLLKGVPPESFFRHILSQLTDKQLIQMEREHHEFKIAGAQ